VPTEPGDKFCRNCGARCDGGASATASPGSTSSAGSATTVLPAARVVGGQPPGSSPGSSPAPASPSATMFFGAVTVERSAKLLLVRGHTQFGSQWRLQAGETAIGRNTGVVLFPDDAALADRHARLVFRGPDLFLEPAPSTNGVFVRLRAPVQLHEGDEFIVGQQRLRLLPEHERPRAVPPPPPGTLLLGSATRASAPALALARITPDPTQVEVYVRHQRLLTLGRTHCDVNFPVDGFVSERHAQLTHEGDHVLLEDLKSRNGTYVRATGSWRLAHGDLLLLGEQVLRVELQQR
jgi:pSer/pThr/pTyr-binding forkhead associated (FHA) protein